MEVTQMTSREAIEAMESAIKSGDPITVCVTHRSHHRPPKRELNYKTCTYAPKRLTGYVCYILLATVLL